MTDPRHVPVLLDRVKELLTPQLSAPGAVVVDATLGLGGHAEALLEAFADLRIIGIDRDATALAMARERLAGYGDRVMFAQAVYDEITDVVNAAGQGISGQGISGQGISGQGGVNGVLFDLGVSSMQIDVAERGFAYAKDAPLDMRMSAGDSLTAAEVLNTYSVSELTRILHTYGEERFARRIAIAVVASRDSGPFSSSARLVELIRASIPAAARRKGGNPAKRTFQALRIEVNDELGALDRALPAALAILAVGGRVAVLSYHSLEDRITKRAFAKVTTSTGVPRDLPVVPAELQPKYRLVTRGSEKANPSEIDRNRRAQSVRLRVVERIAA